MNAPVAAPAVDLGTGGYEVDILVHGYPGKSVCHGGLGWSTIALLRGHGRVALVDVGSFGQRGLVVQGLARHGLAPADVTDVLLTHCHWDHSVNWVMFPKARIVIGEGELAWSLKEPWGTPTVPELYVRELDAWPKAARVNAGDEVLPGITCHDAPGHTPGHLVFLLRGENRGLILTGDAAKNRAELLSLEADMTLDPAVSRRSMEAIWALWRERPGTILIPGHDMPMVLEGGEPRYLRAQEAAISSWFDRSLDKATVFQLV
jgi:glyoxylase-like metal-dependent hydrolase (beta-lactamase superfamily II)